MNEKIPSKIKVGGITYNIEVTEPNNFTILGDYFGEINYKEQKIRVANRLALDVMHRTLWHEIIHAIYDNLGFSNHDEQKIDMLAGALYALVVDNPDMFKE